MSVFMRLTNHTIKLQLSYASTTCALSWLPMINIYNCIFMLTYPRNPDRKLQVQLIRLIINVQTPQTKVTITCDRCEEVSHCEECLCLSVTKRDKNRVPMLSDALVIRKCEEWLCERARPQIVLRTLCGGVWRRCGEWR